MQPDFVCALRKEQAPGQLTPLLTSPPPCLHRNSKLQLRAGVSSHRACIRVTEDLHKLLVGHAHVACPEETDVLGPIALLDRQKLLQVAGKEGREQAGTLVWTEGPSRPLFQASRGLRMHRFLGSLAHCLHHVPFST